MAKDPAFLFYSSDFLTGTILLTNEQKGIYITLLCIQHQHGGIIDKESFNIATEKHEIIKKKFKENKHGFYNERLREESLKRINYCKSRSNNKSGRKKRDIISKSYDLHMEDENENENINENIDNIKKFRRPSLDQIKKYCKEIGSSIDPNIFFDNYESSGWIKANGQKIKNWKATIRTWERRSSGDSPKKRML